MSALCSGGYIGIKKERAPNGTLPFETLRDAKLARRYRTERVEGGEGGGTLNVAVTDFAESIATTQLPVPVHAPLQPAKVEPDAAVAVSVTDVPLL
jgi:hypothetical protein